MLKRLREVLTLALNGQATVAEDAAEAEARAQAQAQAAEDHWRKVSTAYLRADRRGDKREKGRLWPELFEAQVARLRAGV